MENSYEVPHNRQEQIDKVNQACYDNCASIWDRFPFPEAIPKLVKRFYDPSLGNKVLDVGSGTGVLAKWLVEQGYDVQCIDPSPEMVRRCKAKGLQVQQCSMQQYVPHSQFGMVFAILSLIHVPKSDFAIQISKIAEVLPVGGILFLGMLEGSSEGYFEGPTYPRYFAYYTPQEIAAIVSPFFFQLDYHYMKSGIGYMLFTLKKK